LEFQINRYLKLKLEGSETVVYIADKKFRQCKFVIFTTPLIDLSLVSSIDSIDELLDLKIGNQNFHIDGLQVSPEEQFWVHCSSFQVWAENNYDTALLDSYLAFPILKRLSEVGDVNAKEMFKEEIVKKLRIRVPQVLRFLIREDYPSFLDQEELFYGILNDKEAMAIEGISRNAKKEYNLVFDFDELRKIFFNTFRDKDEVKDHKYYFTAFNGNIYEFELLINDNNPSLPKLLENFKYLNRLYLYINNLSLELPRFGVCIESLRHLKIFCFGKVKLPNLFYIFPNLRSLEIYGDISGLTHLEVDDKAIKKLDQIKHKLKNVILKKEIS
jgi:hypothetical protein